MIALCFSSFLIHSTTLVSQNYLVCLAEEQQIVYISRFYSIAALCITFTEMCLLSFETSCLLFHCFRFYFLLMMDIAKSETFKNFIILNKALLFLIKFSNSPPNSPVFMHKILLKKLAVENVFEQIIELQLSGSGPPGRTCSPITGYFHDKTKVSAENLRVDYYLLLKCCKRQCTLLPPTWTRSLTIKIYPQNARC